MAHLRLGYQNASGRPAFLKLDVNFLDRVPVLPTQRLQLRHPFTGDLPNVTVQTLALPELAAAKAIALARRSLARDLFDVAMLSGLKGLDVELMRTVLVVRGASYPPPSPADYTPTVVDRIRTTSWRSEVLALCRRPIPLDLDQARSVAGSLLEQLVDLAPGHVEFLAALDRGELRPGVLPGEGWPERVSLNPGLSWRLRTGLEGLEER